jgi:Glycosyl hydrolase family 99
MVNAFARPTSARTLGEGHFRSWLIATMLLQAMCIAGPGRVIAAPADPIPVLAYYYIWFDVNSWNRAKIDYPLLGRYSSDDADVMRQHIQWAKAAGIKGFIVSWKSTEKLNRRLGQLIDLADVEDFKLAIIYQGLDFERNPLPVERVAADLEYFVDHYANHAAFNLFEKPVVIWSGTWKFSRDEIAFVTEGLQDFLLILASEKNTKGYERLADVVDGDAYYWSSVNPDTFPGYAEKLTGMGEVIHANEGLWIAPVAAAFDAKLIGGTTVVERKDGETLQKEMKTALQSSPDAIGLISWNEFSENSHIEPSVNYGNHYLEVLTDIRDAASPQVGDFDSSAPANTLNAVGIGRVFALGTLGALVLIRLVVIIRRDRPKNERIST